MTKKQQEAVDFFAARGWVVDGEAKTRKYVVMYRPPGRPGRKRLYLGKMGAVRLGLTVSGSRSIGQWPKVRDYLTQIGGKVDGKGNG